MKALISFTLLSANVGLFFGPIEFVGVTYVGKLQPQEVPGRLARLWRRYASVNRSSRHDGFGTRSM
jgi:hypothetical protein